MVLTPEKQSNKSKLKEKGCDELATLINEVGMVEKNIFKYEERLKSPIRRFSDKSFVPVSYYHIRASSSTTDKGFGDVEEILGKHSPIKFEKIDNFPLYGLDQMVLQLNVEDQGLDSNFESDAIIMAGTLKPLQNDYFMIKHLKDSYIFRVTGVEYDTVVSSGCYKINYILEYIDSEMKENLKSQTVDEFTCIVENIGTSDKCIIQSETYDRISKIDKMYDDICKVYMAFYYNERYNCFLADFGNGEKLYDPFQLEFITEHQVFKRKNEIDSLFMSEQFEDPRRKIKYQKTIYRFFETKKMDKLSNFDYTVFSGMNNQQTAFFRWLDKSIKVMDIPKEFDPTGRGVYHTITNEFVESIRLNIPTTTKSAELLQRYARDEELTIDDISLEIADELMELDDANLEVFFFTPIILYIIKEIVSHDIHDESNK